MPLTLLHPECTHGQITDNSNRVNFEKYFSWDYLTKQKQENLKKYLSIFYFIFKIKWYFIFVRSCVCLWDVNGLTHSCPHVHLCRKFLSQKHILGKM